MYAINFLIRIIFIASEFLKMKTEVGILNQRSFSLKRHLGRLLSATYVVSAVSSKLVRSPSLISIHAAMLVHELHISRLHRDMRQVQNIG